MTDDELHTAWVGGVLVQTIAHDAQSTMHAIAGRVRRLRRKEGEDRWPLRASVAQTKPNKHAHVKRAGASTLPPLGSLR
jgi:hypothetical protein